MPVHRFDSELKMDLIRRGFTRRAFGRMATLVASGATLPFYNESALAQLSAIGRIPEGAVKINANENPLGPCPEAMEALLQAARIGGRYQYEESSRLCGVAAEQEGVRSSYVLAFPGSSAPLHQTVLAFCSPEKSLVMANPGYEAGAGAASYIGAQVHHVPLTPDYAHDIEKMVKVDPGAGVLYICNPNNPSGSVTARARIEYALVNKPKGSILLVDEAYLHFSGEPPCTDLVAQDKEIIVLRTFSKIYGMAGLRAGLAFGRPDLLQRIRIYNAGALPATAMVAATASLQSKSLVPERRRMNREVREDTLEFLDRKGFRCVPSESNKFMVDVQRPARDVVRALAAERVYVGRVWPVWPNHCRVTVGTSEEMARFKEAFAKVTA